MFETGIVLTLFLKFFFVSTFRGIQVLLHLSSTLQAKYPNSPIGFLGLYEFSNKDCKIELVVFRYDLCSNVTPSCSTHSLCHVLLAAKIIRLGLRIRWTSPSQLLTTTLWDRKLICAVSGYVSDTFAGVIATCNQSAIWEIAGFCLERILISYFDSNYCSLQT